MANKMTTCGVCGEQVSYRKSLNIKGIRDNQNKRACRKDLTASELTLLRDNEFKRQMSQVVYYNDGDRVGKKNETGATLAETQA